MNASVTFSTIPTASGHVFGRATLNAAANLNALSLEMIDLLAAQFDAWAVDSQVVGVMLDAAGDKAFCAGGDVVALHRSIRVTERGRVPQQAATFFEREYRLDHRIHTYPKPVLCWGHGIVMGGGIGLMADASHRVVTARTKLAMPEITIGLYPDVGGSWFLGRAPGRSGLFLALTGAPLNASDACFAGLADIQLRHEDQGNVIEAIADERWTGRQVEDAARLSHLLRGAQRRRAGAAFAAAIPAGAHRRRDRPRQPRRHRASPSCTRSRRVPMARECGGGLRKGRADVCAPGHRDAAARQAPVARRRVPPRMAGLGRLLHARRLRRGRARAAHRQGQVATLAAGDLGRGRRRA